MAAAFTKKFGIKEVADVGFYAVGDVKVEGGNVTLTGGSLAVNFLGGKVAEVTENSVTVSCSDGFDVIYSNLNEVLVAKDDVVSQYQVLGKYKDSAVVNLVQDGQPITNVSANGYTLSW